MLCQERLEQHLVDNDIFLGVPTVLEFNVSVLQEHHQLTDLHFLKGLVELYKRLFSRRNHLLLCHLYC